MDWFTVFVGMPKLTVVVSEAIALRAHNVELAIVSAIVSDSP